MKTFSPMWHVIPGLPVQYHAGIALQIARLQQRMLHATDREKATSARPKFN